MFNLAGIVRNLMSCPLVIEKDLSKKLEKSTETMLFIDDLNKHYNDSLSSPTFE